MVRISIQIFIVGFRHSPNLGQYQHLYHLISSCLWLQRDYGDHLCHFPSNDSNWSYLHAIRVLHELKSKSKNLSFSWRITIVFQSLQLFLCYQLFTIHLSIFSRYRNFIRDTLYARSKKCMAVFSKQKGISKRCNPCMFQHRSHILDPINKGCS